MPCLGTLRAGELRFRREPIPLALHGLLAGLDGVREHAPLLRIRLAPTLDQLGQLRADDPAVMPEAGLGQTHAAADFVPRRPGPGDGQGPG